MIDNENYLLRNNEPAVKAGPDAVLDRRIDTEAILVDGSPKEGFESLTFVSSKGFFFQ